LRYHDGRRGAALRRALRVDVEFAFPAVGVDVGDIVSRAHFLEKRDGGPQIAGRLRSRRKRKGEHDDDTERKAFSMSTSHGWRRQEPMATFTDDPKRVDDIFTKESVMAHPVMWFEVLGKDGRKLQQFYGGLFGWTFDVIQPINYGVAKTGDSRGIMGGVGQTFPGTRPWVTFYIETPDVTASLDKASSLGGKIVTPRTVMPDVTLGVFEDPEGHVIGLVEARAGAQ
jgi:predicted enzyme related to lactoylglutathione lyase